MSDEPHVGVKRFFLFYIRQMPDVMSTSHILNTSKKNGNMDLDCGHV